MGWPDSILLRAATPIMTDIAPSREPATCLCGSGATGTSYNNVLSNIERKFILNYMIAQLDDMETQQCACGTTRRAFVTEENDVATMHMVDISKDSRTHYHKKMTEIYLILEGEGHLELDGEMIPVKPLTTIFIKPGCRHRAVGKLKIVNIPIPAFDPEDEFFD